MNKKLEEISLGPNTSLGSAARIMDKSGLRIILVKSSDKKLIGVLSYGDLRRLFLSGYRTDTPVNKVCNTEPVFALKGTSINKIKSLSRSKIDVIGGIILVPIVDSDMRIVDLAITDNKSEIGLLSERNIFKKRNIERILVTGGAGYLGSVLVRQLLKSGYQVKVLDSLKFGKDSLTGIWAHRNFDLIVGNILNINDVIEAVKDVDAVVHLAAIVGDEASRENPTSSIAQNTIATISIASVCKKFQINRFIFTSTCSVYGASLNSKALTEKSPLSPVSLYAQSKIDSEFELLRLADGNFSPTILRLATLCGWSYRPRFDLVVNLFSALAFYKKEVNVFGGKQWRPFVSVADASRAIIAVLESPISKIAGETFNVGSDEQNYTIEEIAEIVKTKVKDVVIKKSQSEEDLRNYKVSFSKIGKKIGFKCSRDVGDEIEDIVKNLKSTSLKATKVNAFNSPGLIKAFQ